MPKMRYEFRDLLTNEKLDVLPLYGVNMTWNLMSKDNTNFGSCTGTFRSDIPGRNVADLLAATEPARTALWCFRDDLPIWGGIVWSRTYSSQAGGTYQLYSQSFDSYLARQIFISDESWTDDARNIIRNCWLKPLVYGPNFNIRCNVPNAIATNLTNITKNVEGSEQVIIDDVVKEMISMGAEYRMTYALDVNGAPTFSFELGRWDGLDGGVGIPAGDGAPEVTYPGLISNYWLTDSGSKGGTHFWAIGKANGPSTPRSSYIAAERLYAGYPGLFQKLNFSDTETQTLLDARTQKEGQQATLPYVTPSFKFAPMNTTTPVASGRTPSLSFGSVDLGDYIYTIINDSHRFVDPFKAHYRVMTMSLSPSGEALEDFEFGVGQKSGVA